jgi:hypothetical protein
MPFLYLREEPTTDRLAESDYIAGQVKRLPRDVVAYRDPDATQPAGRWPWNCDTRPKRRHKLISFNCATYRPLWLPTPD